MGHLAQAIGEAGLRPAQNAAPLDFRAIVAAVQAEMLPYDKNLFRSQTGLLGSLERLHRLWRDLRAFGHGAGPGALRSREVASMTAHARWCYGAALARQESRGMHRRIDAPERDARLTHRLIVGGLDQVWVQPSHRTGQIAA